MKEGTRWPPNRPFDAALCVARSGEGPPGFRLTHP